MSSFLALQQVMVMMQDLRLGNEITVIPSLAPHLPINASVTPNPRVSTGIHGPAQGKGVGTGGEVASASGTWKRKGELRVFNIS